MTGFGKQHREHGFGKPEDLAVEGVGMCHVINFRFQLSPAWGLQLEGWRNMLHVPGDVAGLYTAPQILLVQ